MSKKETTRKASTSSAAGKATKNSLVENINNRKKAGTSRPKQNSTISKKAYADMQKGWAK